jgi:hypothetical protein
MAGAAYVADVVQNYRALLVSYKFPPMCSLYLNILIVCEGRMHSYLGRKLYN